ncbi:cell division protein CrgA [Cryptosporangium sp. NPDC048952]|uniref:cell division protein CrgA n=1 Tax=Cryptosporangium sp. NPDC048952 TaxID=3363961 RepID=UPI003710F96B
MPKSRVRQKKVYKAPADVRPSAATTAKRAKPSPRWVPGVAVGLIVAGIAWLVTYYMTQGEYPIAELSAWNLAIGFSMLVASLGVFTQWR